MKIEILKKSDIESYKALIDECFEVSNDISEYENIIQRRIIKL